MSRDHEIVRAQKKVSKGRPNTPPTSCSVVTGPQVQCEVICDRSLTQMLFRWISIHAGPHTWWNGINQQSWAFGVSWSPNDFMSGLRPRGSFWKKNSSDHETWSIWCHVGIHIDFYIRLTFTYSVGPSSVLWSSELGPAPPVPPMRVLEVSWSWAPSLVCEVALSLSGSKCITCSHSIA